MSDPYVRPDVRLFLDHYNKPPGPRAHEVGPNEARAKILARRIGVEALKPILAEAGA